jgi:hypothetical protein
MLWRNAQGYACQFDPDGVTKECDTATCYHCNRVFHINPSTRPEDVGGYCRICEKIICGPCVDGPCHPFEKKLAAWEAKTRARHSYGV